MIFFVNVGPKLASDIQNTGKNYYDYLHNMRSSNMYMKPIFESDILKIVSKFNVNKSAGHDNIGNVIINGWQLAKMKKSIPDMSLP